MQLKFDNLNEYIVNYGEKIVEEVRYQLQKPQPSRQQAGYRNPVINYDKELSDSTKLIVEQGTDSLTVNVSMLERYRNILPVSEGGTTSVVASVNDIADWIVRKPVLESPDPLTVANMAKNIVRKLAEDGYNTASRVNFVSEALRRKRKEFMPAKQILLDIKQQILVILKEAGINTEGKDIKFT